MKVLPDIREMEGYRITVLARSGHGKSYLTRYLIERIIDNYAMPIVIIEPVSEYESLLELYDGLLFKDEDGVPLEPYTMAEATPEAPVVVINYEDTTMTRARQLLAKYLQLLIGKAKRSRRPFLLVVEEAHLLAPQRYTKASMDVLEQMEYIAKLGRKLGINYILVSQRPANLNKDVLSQVNTAYLGAFSHPIDVKAAVSIADSLGHTVDPEELSGLDKGKFIQLLPRSKALFKAPKPKSRHLGGTPIDIKPILAKRLDFQELAEKARKRLEEQRQYITITKEEYDTLKKQIRELEREKERLEQELDKYKIKLETIQLISEKLATTQATVEIPSTLLPELESRILESLRQEPTHKLALYELARKAGTSRKSSRFLKALRTLKALGYIEYDTKRGYAKLKPQGDSS
ncbi:MAG: DUF853 family protein [Desulfurococcales archaeon]|nr:DUF853 family protein [Desulfurococcales archaeon]